MEDIKKAIEENKFWRTFIKENRCWTPIADAIGKLAYNNGYNKAKKEFEESTRWRKFTTDELPNVGDIIVVRNGGCYSVAVLKYYDEIKYCCEKYQEWQPIIK